MTAGVPINPVFDAALLDVITDVVWFKDIEGRYIAVNAAFANSIGRNRAELVGLCAEHVFPPALAARMRQRDAVSLERGEAITIEEQIAMADGQQRWFETVSAPMRDARGTIIGTSGVARDVTARRNAEAAQRAGEARLHAMFASSPFGIGMADRNGYFIDANDAYLDLIGYSLEELRSKRFADLSSGGDVGENLVQFEALVEGTLNTFSIEKSVRRKTGENIDVRVKSAAVRDDAGEFAYVVAMVEDITAQKRAEQELEARETQFRLAQKMEAVGRLAGGVAHDFNNLLTVIIAHAEFLRRSERSTDDWREDVNQIADAAFHASGLTRQLLAFGRQQLLQPRAISLNEVVENLTPLLRRSLGEDVRLELELDPSLPRVHADPGQLDQVIVNLVSNARDAMPRGGSLTLSTHFAAPASEVMAGIGESTSDVQVALSVRDTGVGIDPAIEPRIFEPFFTTKEQSRGTGLGLSTVYGIIRQSNGTVAVQSAVGAGTTVTITLPVSETETTAPQQIAPGTTSDRGVRATILLVEDEPTVRMLAKRILVQRGYDVVDAANGTAALKWLDENSQPIALLLTDVVMPGMSGRDLASEAMTRRPDLRVVYTSGYADDVFDRGLLPVGTALVPKPFTAAALLSAIHARLAAPV
jgi:PAS domain S-box-containing protein